MPETAANQSALEIEPGRLSPFGQLAWISCCLNLLELSHAPHRLVVSSGGLHDSVRRVLDSGFPERFFPSRSILVSETPQPPTPTETFACVSGSEVLTSQLLARFERVFVRPSALPRKVDTGLFMLEQATGAFLQPLSAAVDEGLLHEAYHEWHVLKEGLAPSLRSVSLITSIFKGDRFLEQFLANSESLENYASHEHFLVRAASPGNEHDALLDFAHRHANAVYINLEHDPGLYDVWNLVACLASGRYLSNANIDDRRNPAHLAKLSQVLDEHEAVDVASGALRVWHVPNTPWETSGNCKVWYASEQHPKGEYGWRELFRTLPEGETASRNLPHCMPVWRRSLHARHGLFREEMFGPSADWEFWLRSGSRGARFYLLKEPLGLYLKTAESYWNTSGDGQDFDARIIARYYPRNAGELENDQHSLDAGFDELEKFACVEGRFSHFHRLAQLAFDVLRSGDRGDRVKRLDDTALNAFGITGFSGFMRRLRSTGATVTEQTAFDLAVRLLRQRESEGLTTEAFELWRLVFADYAASSGRLDEALLAVARLHWLRQERTEAWRLMEGAHSFKEARFWTVLQTLFRFELPLSDLAERLTNGQVHVPERVKDGRDINLWYYPDFRNNNYQAHLYEPLKRTGATVRAIDRDESIDIVPDNPAALNVLHIHWIHVAFVRRGKTPAQAADDFLAAVERVKARGVRVIWTVHNYVSHDARHRDMELAFRRKLAGLVDEVYLHHPMIRDELDWLPENVVPRILEHGSYALSEDWRDVCRTVRTRLGIPGSARVVACAGQLRPYKQLEVFLPELLSWVERTPDAWLLVLGKSTSPELSEMLASVSNRRVCVIDRFLPADELDDYLCAADFGFLSYTSILTSGTLFHMLSRALPVIAPRKGTIPAYVVDGWNGFVYDDADSVANVLMQVRDLDDAVVAQMRDNAVDLAGKLHWVFRLDTTVAPGPIRTSEISRLSERCTELEQTLSAVEHDKDALLEYAKRLEKGYDHLVKSRSWKLTRPLRAFGRLLRRLLKGRAPTWVRPRRPKLRGKS